MSSCSFSAISEMESIMYSFGFPIPDSTGGAGKYMAEVIGGLAAAAAVNPSTPASAVLGSSGVGAFGVAIVGVTAAGVAGLLIGAGIRAGYLKLKLCG